MSRDGYQHCVLRLTTGRNPRWYCRYTKRVIAGPRQTKSIQTRKYFGLKAKMTRREAEKACTVFRLAVNSAKEIGVRESQVPLANWIATYEATYLPTLKPNSQAVYRSTLNAIRERFGTMRLCDISRDGIQQWFNELAKTRARATLQRMLATFTSLFEEAIASDSYEARNPCERVKLPVGQRSTVELRALTPDEVRRLLGVCEVMDAGKTMPTERNSRSAGVDKGTSLSEIYSTGVYLRPGILGRSGSSGSNATREAVRPEVGSGSDDVLGPDVLCRPSTEKHREPCVVDNAEIREDLVSADSTSDCVLRSGSRPRRNDLRGGRVGEIRDNREENRRRVEIATETEGRSGNSKDSMGSNSLTLAVRIALFCGLRIGEILALDHEDCRDGAIRVSKNKAQYSDEITTPKSAAGARVVPVGPVVIPRGRGPLFSMPYRTAHEALRKAFSAAEISIDGTAWHALRRTFATYFEAAGAVGMRAQMGHSTEAMSLQYVRRGFEDHAAAVNRMAGFLLGDTGGTTKQ